MALSTIDAPLKITAGGDTAAGDDAAIGVTASEGLILTGQGSTADITIKNDADTLVASVATGTTVMNFASAITVGGSALSNTATNAAVTGTVVKGTTSLQTPLIEFTDGDDAMAIADGGVVTFSQKPVFTLGGGGSYEKLATTTLTGAAAGVAFNSGLVTSTYNNFYVTVAGILPVTANADIGLYLSVDNGSNFATHLSGNHYLQLNGSGNGWSNSQNSHYIVHDSYNVAGELKVSGYALIMNTNDTTAYKSIFGRGMTRNNGTNANDYAYSTYTSFVSTTAVNYIIVKANSGNLQGFGTVELYGIR